MEAGTRTRISLDGRFETDDMAVKSPVGWGEHDRLRRVENIVLRNLIPHNTTVLESRR